MTEAFEGAEAQEARRGIHPAMIALALVAGAMVLGVAMWARFLTGISAAPVPGMGSFTDAVPVLSATASAVDSSVSDPSAADSSAPASSTVDTAGTGATDALPSTAATPSAPQLATPTAVEPTVDAAWLDRTAASTGISRRALQAYAGADLELEREKPSCGLGWNTLAGIGRIESNNGRTLTDAGYSTTQILGPTVSGSLHAQGPMQFMPGTWAKWGADGNGDGAADPNQIDDAALAAARYLCSYGRLDTVTGWHAAVFGYNHLESYVSAVAAQATLYAQRAGS